MTLQLSGVYGALPLIAHYLVVGPSVNTVDTYTSLYVIM